MGISVWRWPVGAQHAAPLRLFRLNNNIPIFVHNCLLLRLNQRGRIQLFDNRRGGYFIPGFETVTSVNLCGQCAVLLAEDYFALTGLCFVDFTTRHLSRSEFCLRHESE